MGGDMHSTLDASHVHERKNIGLFEVIDANGSCSYVASWVVSCNGKEEDRKVTYDTGKKGGLFVQKGVATLGVFESAKDAMTAACAFMQARRRIGKKDGE